MSAFSRCQQIEEHGLRILTPLLYERSGGRYVRTDKGRLSYEIQKKYGDFFANNTNGEIIALEIKVEEKHTGNLFLEEYSNREHDTPGWMETLDADVLWYLFLDRRLIYEIHFPSLRTWYQENKHKHPLVKQGKYVQMNDTWGRLAPIQNIIQEIQVQRTWISQQKTFHTTIMLPKVDNQMKLFSHLTRSERT